MSPKFQNKLLFAQRDSHSDNCKQNPFDIVPREDYDYKSSVDIAIEIKRAETRIQTMTSSLRTSKHLSATEGN